MNIISRKLKQNASVAALVAAASFVGPAAMAQGAADSESIETVTVTGTAIRGVATIGSNVIAVDSDAIASLAPASMEGLVSSIPALSGGYAPQGQNSAMYYSPSIHQLAGSASNSTLVLIDGNRIPQGGSQHSQTDPGIIPTIALAGC